MYDVLESHRQTHSGHLNLPKTFLTFLTKSGKSHENEKEDCNMTEKQLQTFSVRPKMKRNNLQMCILQHVFDLVLPLMAFLCLCELVLITVNRPTEMMTKRSLAGICSRYVIKVAVKGALTLGM
jgi:hypothetical protein